MLSETLLRLYAPTLPPGPWPHSIPPPRPASRATSLNENSIRYFLIQDATPRGPYPLPPRLRQAKKRPAGQTRIHADRMDWGNGRKPRSSRRARGRPRATSAGHIRRFRRLTQIPTGRRLEPMPAEPRATSHESRATGHDSAADQAGTTFTPIGEWPDVLSASPELLLKFNVRPTSIAVF